MNWVLVLYGAIGGLAYALSGLASKEKRESFELKKFLPTIILALVIGAIAGFSGQDYGIVANSAGVAGFTAVLQKFYNSIFAKA